MGIALVGIELEGLWTSKCQDRIRDSGARLNWQNDGSVELEREDTTGETYPEGYLKQYGLKSLNGGVITRLPTYGGWAHRGEAVSLPLTATPEIISKWLESAYPAAVNQTCGLHMHVSFTTLGFYYRTVSQAYFDAVYGHFEAWGKERGVKNKSFWKRLNGENSFCRKLFVPDKQVWHTGKGNDRYCGVNYCYSRYKTIEIRLLPMFKSCELAISAVNDFIAFTNKFLVSSRLVTVNEEVNESLPNLTKETERLQLKKLLTTVSNGELVPPLSLAQGQRSTRTEDAREALRTHILASRGRR
jgi:hypothetical protein